MKMMAGPTIWGHADRLPALLANIAVVVFSRCYRPSATDRTGISVVPSTGRMRRDCSSRFFAAGLGYITGIWGFGADHGERGKKAADTISALTLGVEVLSTR